MGASTGGEEINIMDKQEEKRANNLRLIRSAEWEAFSDDLLEEVSQLLLHYDYRKSRKSKHANKKNTD